MAYPQLLEEAKSTMLYYEGEEEQYLQFQGSCEAFITAFVSMKVGPDSASSTFSAKGLGMDKLSKSDKSKENTGKASGRGACVESSVDPADNQLLRAALDVEASVDASGCVPNGLVPAGLSPTMRGDLTTLEQGDISRLYDVSSTVAHVSDGSLASTELVTLHLRSFRNIYQYELSDVELLKRRFLRFFARVFMELVDLCYPDRGNSSLEELLLRDFREYQQKQQKKISEAHRK